MKPVSVYKNCKYLPWSIVIYFAVLNPDHVCSKEKKQENKNKSEKVTHISRFCFRILLCLEASHFKQ